MKLSIVASPDLLRKIGTVYLIFDRCGYLIANEFRIVKAFHEGTPASRRDPLVVTCVIAKNMESQIPSLYKEKMLSMKDSEMCVKLLEPKCCWSEELA